MKLKDYPDWHEVVKADWHTTTGYVLALGGLCLSSRERDAFLLGGLRLRLRLPPGPLPSEP